ncbi:T9SS type A sorting domain-containing protein [bacterium]|nr:T9SS type A sorting domain-containing protein [bacterium]
MYKSEDGGASWSSMNTGLFEREYVADFTPNGSKWWFGDYYSVSDIKFDPLDPDQLWSGHWGGGIYKSDDNGIHWQPMNEGLPDNLYCSVILPLEDQLLAGAGLNPGLYRSEDDGLTWQPITDLPSGYTLQNEELVQHPDSSNLILASDWYYLYKSIDSGISWTILTPLVTITKVFFNPVNVNEYWCTRKRFGTDFHLMHSVDSGTSWEEVTIDGVDDIVSIAINPEVINQIYALSFNWGADGLYKSYDNGESWVSTGSGLIFDRRFSRSLSTKYPLVINPHDTQTLLVGSSHGVFKSTNGGDSFARSNGGLVNTYIHDVQVHPTDSLIAYAGGEQGYWETIDGGSTWTSLHNSRIEQIAIDQNNPDIQYIVGDELWRTFDGGNIWENRTPGSVPTTLIAIDPLESTRIYLGVYPSTIYRSDNSGETWESYSTGAGSSDIFQIGCNPLIENVVYLGQIGTASNGFYKSLNNGQSWNRVSDFLVRDFVFHPTIPNTIYAVTADDILKSTTNSVNFSSIRDTLTDCVFNSITINESNPQQLYVGTRNKGLYVSHNGGENWAHVSTIPEPRIESVAVYPGDHSNKVYVGTHGSGTYVGSDVVTSINDFSTNFSDSEINPIDFLGPNPFNNQIKFSYTLESPSDVRVSIINIQGKEMYLLNSGHHNAGIYSTTWDGTVSKGITATSGVYIVRLIVDQRVYSKKITILR